MGRAERRSDPRGRSSRSIRFPRVATPTVARGGRRRHRRAGERGEGPVHRRRHAQTSHPDLGVSATAVRRPRSPSRSSRAGRTSGWWATSSTADRYGRTLAYVYRRSDGLFVNAELVAAGHARRSPRTRRTWPTPTRRRARQGPRGRTRPVDGVPRRR
ncbi:MAG: thermonuclease family protein [Acidimicrobiia bacterium]|nr:thermonuclease family protein [Acidimicrobiia bacterium]